MSVMDMVPVSAGRSRTDALTDMTVLARAADAAGYERYWLAEHHGSATYLSSATIVLMGQVLAATEHLGVASGGIMLPNHAPLVVAEQIGTLATLYPGRVDLGLGRAPGTDRRTAAALRRGASDPRHFAEEILEILTYLGDESAPGPHAVPGSLLLGSPGVLDDDARGAGTDGPRVRAIPGEGTHPTVWVLGSSVNGARVAGRLGLPFAVASHFAPVQAEAAIATYRSVLESQAEGAQGVQGAPRVAAAVSVMVAAHLRSAGLVHPRARQGERRRGRHVPVLRRNGRRCRRPPERTGCSVGPRRDPRGHPRPRPGSAASFLRAARRGLVRLSNFFPTPPTCIRMSILFPCWT